MKTKDFIKQEVSRRQFLESSAKNAAGVAAGMVGLAQATAKAAASERISLAVVGVRHQGKFLANSFAGFADVDVTAVCDIDENLLPSVSQSVEERQGKPTRRETDFRRLLDSPSIDAIVIATPDHWHAPLAIMACQAGKDVYVEKPVSHNIAEGEQMVAAAGKYKRVVQAGMHQRSAAHFQSAVEAVQSGMLGSVKLAKAWTVHRRKPIEFKKETTPPDGVDYDMWLGPAPLRPFQPNRFHSNWRWFWDYGTGEMGNWGVHMLDIARWGLGVELPLRISASGGKYYFDDERETPDTYLVNFSYPGKTIHWEHRLWSSHGPEGRSAAAAFYGEKGTLVVDRSGWKVYDRKEPITSPGSDQASDHHRNFIDCIKTRETPVADIQTGHITSALCHLGNIAHRLQREVIFTPEQMSFGTDNEAEHLLSREYRNKWELPEV